MSDENFISRWSRRKLAAKTDPAPVEADNRGQTTVAPEGKAAPDSGLTPVAAVAGESGLAPVEVTPPQLPDVASLSPQSDFTPFMGREVDASLRSRALKTLFQDPHYNVMDGLDVYIDDYTKTTPLPPGMLERLEQLAYLGDRGARDAAEKLAAAEAGATAEVPHEAEESASISVAPHDCASPSDEAPDDTKARAAE